MAHRVLTLRIFYEQDKRTASYHATSRTMTTRFLRPERRKLGHVHPLLGGELPSCRLLLRTGRRDAFCESEKRNVHVLGKRTLKKRLGAAWGKHTSQFLCHNKSLCGQVWSKNTAGGFYIRDAAIWIPGEASPRGAAQHGRVLRRGSTRVSGFSRRRLITAQGLSAWAYCTSLGTEVQLRPPQSLWGGVVRLRSDPWTSLSRLLHNNKKNQWETR